MNRVNRVIHMISHVDDPVDSVTTVTKKKEALLRQRFLLSDNFSGKCIKTLTLPAKRSIWYSIMIILFLRGRLGILHIAYVIKTIPAF